MVRAVPGPFESKQQHRETIRWHRVPTKARYTLNNDIVSGLTTCVCVCVRVRVCVCVCVCVREKLKERSKE